MKNKISAVAVIGAGAVGSYFGGLLARAGYDVTLIARQDHVKAIQENGLYMECQSFQERVSVKASTEYQAIKNADLILFCVKSPDTESVAKEIKPYLSEDSIILSLQNGVDNAGRIRAVLLNPVYPAVVYVATGMAGPGHVKHFGRGELVIGDLEGNEACLDQLNMLQEYLKKGNIPCGISKNIKHDMWLKFLVNCSYNAISGIGQIEYGQMVQSTHINTLIEQITKEFLAVAGKEGLNITLEQAILANEQIAKTMTKQKSSTAQDLMKFKKTEIDFLNGYIVRRGLVHQIPTPANQSVYALVKMLEMAYLK
ncbi:ketopantoate reductase family protein [Polynucleobacter sp. AM-26B4]|uniref:ketopantoate reductase family protein n=1 Tax=Polynucleobacter sp. AM-26B4 TaxID=2689103 RepID=UPI001C0E07B9|nr:2-dehydropantoate 2-reductase [Polynucleobacter sp. AM-26B4]MBU3585439.1 2-dehydropantoate 2-reductase [Polynucleobacter sp. AM-26B4]